MRSALSLRVFGEDITVAGRQAAAAAAEKQGTTRKQAKEGDVALKIEDTSSLRPTDGTTEGADGPGLKSEEEEKPNLSLGELF